MAARETWSDARLDDLNTKVDAGFRESREEFHAVRAEMKAGFDRVDDRFDRVDDGFNRVNDQMLALQRTIIQLFAGIIATMLVGLLGVIASILTLT